ncbi:uncharacterized protein LOC120265228 [Dioscorea cayenensis subsp. rotundata]|uniref:Uncharacterized protein LOC120265228 n=1 Tax=Dioscorea cayennensis subsp. rotundata TaxID=55577 RepID=A0AB40BPZ9_DIOCR|nr:uncharacterized protein LOC120265228 [Dioscorea cayenensis subsp. rotundata]
MTAVVLAKLADVMATLPLSYFLHADVTCTTAILGPDNFNNLNPDLLFYSQVIASSKCDMEDDLSTSLVDETASEEEDFTNPDFDILDGNDDYEQVMSEQRQWDIDIYSYSEFNSPKGNPDVGGEPDTSDEESDSENCSSEDLLTRKGSDDDGESRFLEFNEEKDLYNPKLRVGMVFRDFDQLKKACRNWGIKHRFQIWFPQNDNKRVICACHNKQCSFKIYAAHMKKDNPLVQIKSANLDHSCGKVFNNFHVTSKWLASKYLDKYKADPNWSCNGLIKQVKDDHGLTISAMKAWRTKHLAMKWVNGDASEQYTKLCRYAAKLKQSNPGSTVILWRDEQHFKGFYVCLKPLKDAFGLGCRPFIGLDGCFLKGLYDGQLVSAVGINPNDYIFPIAYAVVLVENTETWAWFIELLRDDLEIWNNRYGTIMSDWASKGLFKRYSQMLNTNCVRHIYTNFKEKFKGKALKDYLWNAARASYVQRFNYWLGEIEKENPDARRWLDHEDRPHASWTRALFGTSCKCDILLNNICECFNRYILDTRDKGIITMLEMIKVKLIRRIKRKKDQMLKYKGIICPKIQTRLDQMKKEAQCYTADFSGGPKVQVIGIGGSFIVNMIEHTCTCRRWKLTGLPCPHAISAIYGNNQQPKEFVHAA